MIAEIDDHLDKMESEYRWLCNLRNIYSELTEKSRTPKNVYKYFLTEDGFQFVLREYRLAVHRLNGSDLQQYKRILEQIWGTEVIQAVKDDKWILTADDMDKKREKIGTVVI